MQLHLFVCPSLFTSWAICILATFVIILLFGNNATMQGTPCDKTRQVFNTTWGVITDGPSGSNYTEDSHCEWLIKAQNSEQFITLSFQAMGTECSYDYVFVYDGDSFNSPLLGSFSGKTEPQQITAKSGSMLILLYSDTNYVLGGFQSEFSVSDCPRNCTKHGICISHKCICNQDWGGDDCSVELCPDNCGVEDERGICQHGRCICNQGYSGQSCTLNVGDKSGNSSSWHWLSHSHSGLNRRAAHTAVYVKETDSLYVFGGYDLNNILNDLSVYRFNTSLWEDHLGNILVGSSKATNQLDVRTLASALRQVDVNNLQWGLKSNSLLKNLLSSIAENASWNSGNLSHHLNRSRREAEIEEDAIANQNNPPGDSDRDSSERWKDYFLDKEMNATESYTIVENFPTESFNNATNENVPKEPSPRYGHAACGYPGGFVIYGGKLAGGELSDELWFFNVSSRNWSLRARWSKFKPPKLTRHTITLVEENTLFVFGGSTVGGEFSSKLYSIVLNFENETDDHWRHVRPRGGKELDVRVVAHTTVYHARTNSLLVYGGVMAGLARFSKLSDRMFFFELSNRHWTEIHYPRAYPRETYVPRERAFHTSTILGNYLVVFGGYSHRHNKEEICYDNQMYLYHLSCHTWVSHDILGTDRGSRYRKHQGVFAHAADVRNGNTLLIVGGYHGNVNADLWAYILPPMLASRDGEIFAPESFCYRHNTLLECTSNPECGWCSADEVCYGRTVGTNCTTNLQTRRCPGVCPALGDCHSCLIHREMSSPPPSRPTVSVAHKLKLGQCTWCVQNARCHSKNDNYGVCGLREDTPSQAPGWWGLQGTEITMVEECRVKDRRPGLTFIKYKHPVNLSQPDSVSVINATTVDFEISMKDTRVDQSAGGGVMIAKLTGFLRVPDFWSDMNEMLKMCSSYSNTTLKLSRTHLPSDLEAVGNVSGNLTKCIFAQWPSGSSVVLEPGRYLVDFESTKLVNSNHMSKMDLMHNRSAENARVFTFEYLEPYQNGSCHLYSNCLHCLTDSLCGWCDLTDSCLPRVWNESEFCRLENSDDWHYLTLQPSSCANCSNYISCDLCVASNLCEWWVEDARCSRRGRGAPSAIVDVPQCPQPCHLRLNCSQCLDDKGRCVWCEATQECFSFSVYTSEYQFGLCREWVDQSHHSRYQAGNSLFGRNNNVLRGSEQCKSCSKNVNCSSCLHTLSCGWCYSIDNPIKGVCVAGDFNRPAVESCSSAINAARNESLLSSQSGWSYAQCPDVNECDLKLDNCHPEAVCTNTDGSFTCECRRGFNGDGHNFCTKTCYNKCIHGLCTMAPDYRCQCHLGWTGEDCGIDCGCNNHSTCNQRVGVCDECQNWTTGEFCQYCREGSYGNATTKERCQKCECNGHGDDSKGLCDSKTGMCYCMHNTEGDRCERCKEGYYGDPRNGGICYYQCVARGMLTGSESQGIGSRRANMTPWEFRLEGTLLRECLWILSPKHFNNGSIQESVIQLTIDSDINVKCQDNSVFVYDGPPDLVTSPTSHQSHALGTFCQRQDDSPLTVETKSGVLTILYKQGDSSQGFNASYNIFTCPDDCPSNRICIGKECACMDGWTGPNCSLAICPKNCSFHLKQGVCDKGYGRCLCRQNYGGPDCSVKIHDGQLIFTELFNSARLSESFDHLRKMIPRFGHSLVTDRRGSLWMLGGYSLSHGPLNDIRLFDTKNNTWMQVTVDSTRDASMPQGRYLHAAEIVHSRREIYVFGGIAAKDVSTPGLGNNTLRDFWKFSIKNQRWIDVQTPKTPPPLAGHTLTYMKDQETERLILIGGFSPLNGFLDTVWNFNLDSEAWDILITVGNGPVGVCGHTTVYHQPTNSFYLFGGYMFSVNRTIYSNELYAFHFSTRTWSLLPTFEEYNPMASNFPQPRFLHSAITTKDYMLVFGGRMSREGRFLSEPLDSLIAYSYSCNQWIRLLSPGSHIVGSPPPLTYGQAMTYDPETEAIYIIGGFDNVIQSHVTRINLPLDLCNLWNSKERCRSFLGCSFCSVTRPDKSLSNFCHSSSKSLTDSCFYHNGTLITNNGVVCDARWFEQRSCDQFKTCTECLAKWPVFSNESHVCKWCSNCVRNRCVPFNHTCGSEKMCQDVIQVEQCRELICVTSDCEKCSGNQCKWTGESCVKESLTPDSVDMVKKCPSRCSEHNDCATCLLSNCRWSTALKECISLNYQPLYCAGGVCGLVLKKGDEEQCPAPCSRYNQCSKCLKNSHCGWCSLNKHDMAGIGVCTEGSLGKPLEGPDLDNCETLLSSKLDPALFSNSTENSVSWHYVACPAEDECRNGHHSCNYTSEKCVDLEQGFQCICGAGYKSMHSHCEPVCSQGCVRGVCTQPDVCDCYFGYVGANCSIQCQCNGHSNCAGPDKLDVCNKCHNNTKGAQCERCKPNFVGDPRNNGHCVPCFEYCNEHTNTCRSDMLPTLIFMNKSEDVGPISEAKCIDCSNHTTGKRCDKCLEGYFRGSDDLRRECRPCECHGHGNRCDPVTGENCECANNTESECPKSGGKNSNQQCWMLQCSKCKESFSGTPTEGRQCYKQITLDHKFCLDYKLIEECKSEPKPLYPGQSVFFQVQPRYVNVDIRVILDVTQGSLDLYMSPRDDFLVVVPNATSGRQTLDWDLRRRKGVKKDIDSSSLGSSLPGTNISDIFYSMEHEADGLTTYITINRKNTFLHVRNVRDRLILTLPKDKYDLVSTTFYLALTASAQDESPSYGILFFRQDQLHIDLFVFFSVFFSCFFLFLAGCVVAWKAKQAADLRRARRRHVVEMLHMAKRPFAGVVLHLDNDESEESPGVFSQSPHRKKRNKSNPNGAGELRPVAIEPTDDGIAAIATVFVRLPGGIDAPVRLSLASSLIMMSRVYPLNSRAFLRRRSSHHGLT